MIEYENLKKNKEKEQEDQKVEQLEKLRHDLGEGHHVPISTDVDSAQSPKNLGPPNITLGVGLDSDDEMMEEQNVNEDEQKEAESFKRFLEREKKRKENEEQTRGTN